MMFKIPELRYRDRTNELLLSQNQSLRNALKKIPVEQIIESTGAEDSSDKLALDALFQRFLIDPSDFAVYNEKGDPESDMMQSFLLTYLTTADGTLPTGEKISFRELPNGENYCTAFQGYAPDRLVRHFRRDMDDFSATCAMLGGKNIDIGDAGFEFRMFPKVDISLIYNMGDAYLPDSATLLFDANVSHYMITAGLASIGHYLVEAIVMNSKKRIAIS